MLFFVDLTSGAVFPTGGAEPDLVATDLDASENGVAPLFTAVVFNEGETKVGVNLRLIHSR